MFLLFGETVKVKVINDGVFDCPICKSQQTYINIQEKDYFTLMFIPTFPTSVHAEYWLCRNCKNTFDPNYLEQPAYFSGLQMIYAYLINQYGYSLCSTKAKQLYFEITSFEWQQEAMKSALVNIGDWDTLVKRLKQHKVTIDYSGRCEIIAGVIQLIFSMEKDSYESRVQINLLGSYLDVDSVFIDQVIRNYQ